ncbi:ABC transporter ATP-binding protein [Pseudonocardia endophytica]|uniref:Sulfonate transport system ATP-binding protein n=1 Tax=Pseudonocardia endophytica TaxID=401976 RepID=A0A4R1HIP5_PSEEN|nr:ABC transporter ATP-binding protein [Pseudonocardia endophytica]TCK22127.1 sulfonate transport system ATP-binding protein [Pseudonocardia endophytica]
MGLTTSDPAEAVVSARGLTRRFGDLTVLDDLDVAVASGEFVSVLGRSGTGKSTLLRLLAGIDDAPDAGTVRRSADPGVMFQDARLLPWLRAGDNVALAGGVDDVGALFERVGLDRRLLRAWPRTLSGGQAQRVALARALASRSPLLVLDEPFGALDSLTRLTMQELLVAVRAEHRPAVVLVTHDVEEALVLSDRVLLLDGGRVALDTRLDEPHPRDRTSPALVARRARILAALRGPAPATEEIA